MAWRYVDQKGEAIKEIAAELYEIEEEGAKQVWATAKSLCPVGTVTRAAKGASWQERRPGKLKQSIFCRKGKHGGWIVGVPAAGSDTFYAGFVEMGVPGKKARRRPKKWGALPEGGKKKDRWSAKRQSFLHEAIEQHKEAIKNKMKFSIDGYEK